MTRIPRLVLRLPLPARLLVLGGIYWALAPAVAAADVPEVTAVNSVASPGYMRAKLPDGSFAPETYAFGKGGVQSEAGKDPAIDGMPFIDVARTVAVPLASAKYLPSTNPKDTRLLIMVYWGATAPALDLADSPVAGELSIAQGKAMSGFQKMQGQTTITGRGLSPDQGSAILEYESLMAMQALEQRQSDAQVRKDAGILGYDATSLETAGLENSPLYARRTALISEIADGRYYVVLMAYDFQALWKQKKHTLLWVTRMSVRERGNAFDKILPALARSAAPFFGRDSKGLVHEDIPLGHVIIGTPQTVGDTPQK